MPNLVEVDATASEVMGAIKAPIFRLGGYDYEGAEPLNPPLGKEIGNSFLRASGHIMSGLVVIEEGRFLPKTRDNVSYQDPLGIAFRRISYREVTDEGVSIVHDNLRAVLPLDSQSPFKLVNLKLARGESDMLCTPPELGVHDALKLQLHRDHTLQRPDAVFEASFAEPENNALQVADEGGVLQEVLLTAGLDLDPVVPIVIEQAVDTLYTLESMSERTFDHVQAANILLSHGYDLPKRMGVDPHDPSQQGLLASLVALLWPRK